MKLRGELLMSGVRSQKRCCPFLLDSCAGLLTFVCALLVLVVHQWERVPPGGADSRFAGFETPFFPFSVTGRLVGWLVFSAACALSLAGCPGLAATDLPRFDFRRAEITREWRPAHDISEVKVTPDGWEITITADDPYLIGPARDYPEGQPLWLRVREKSDQGGSGQVFYFNDHPTEEHSVRFNVRPGAWDECRVQLPPLGPGYHLRFDPPGDGGRCVLQSIIVEPRTILTAPEWQAPTPPELSGIPVDVHSGNLAVHYSPGHWGAFDVSLAGRSRAVGWNHGAIGYLVDGQQRWMDLSGAAVNARVDGEDIVVEASVKDPDGAAWILRQRWVPAAAGAINVTTRVDVDRDRDIVFLPMLVIFPGVGSFGTEKGQGLFPGLEYLDNEPSSSQADITVPAYRRQVPDSLKITFPLQVIQAGDDYVGLIGDSSDRFSYLFDSPDRIFHSGGHVMGILFPGSNGQNRDEGSLLPYEGETLKARSTLVLHATLIGGHGTSILPAVQQYAALRGFPHVPSTGLDFTGYVNQAAAGWLDSAIHQGSEVHHAVGASFKPQPAADAAALLLWMGIQSADPVVSARLKDAARDMIGAVKPEDYNQAGVSHVRVPVETLVWGHSAEAASRAAAEGHALAARFEPDGSMLYHAGKTDYGRTHFAKDANGLTSQMVDHVLEDAAFSGDPGLIRDGIRLLRAMDKFRGTVPRGAQTWECPLHTPDILAAAYLLRAYTLGYELTGDRGLLDEAIEWAWSGVPFTYLVNPTGQPVGPYATIAVLGATNWVAPVWMGMPVQWCGLVYSDALYRLDRHDPAGPWKTIADGITASGVQQSWPLGSGDRQGLLPDSFNLRPQTRNNPGINPGTVGMNAIRLFHKPALYDFRVFRSTDLMVHAPGSLTNLLDKPGEAAFKVEAWPDQPYEVLIVGLKGEPRVRVDGKDLPLTAPQQYFPETGRLVLHLAGRPHVEISIGK